MTRRHDQVALGCTTALAAACSLVAAWLSAAGAWNRGGTLGEQTLVAAVAILLTLAVHQLPAALAAGRRMPAAGWALWCACLVCVVWGHLAFFAAANGHAGDARAQRQIEAAASQPVEARAVARPLAVVSAERATVRGDIARLQATTANCRNCPLGAARITALQQRSESLDVEEQEARRAIRQDESARAAALSHAAGVNQARLDPAVRLFAAATGAHAETVLLVTQLAAVICLELVGCVLWLRVASLRTATCEATLPANPPQDQLVTTRPEISIGASRGVSPAEDDQVAAAVRRGELKPTVAAIRQFVGCSQARAMTIRRRLLATGDRAGTGGDT
ncbi:hypothetical protein [Cupriavidus sp.]|uniref:hypothetical protein n=1 Tax=Cupriavidus sp. TaxID=1873897 RepID=UPI0028BD6045|nr:hypothetical protein [Cupriavidus sp.]